MDSSARRLRIIWGGVLLGIGLGGFFDGILLHQILQWHHMLSSTAEYPATTVAGLEVNTLWDGFFHASTYIATVVGLFLVWRPPGRRSSCSACCRSSPAGSAPRQRDGAGRAAMDLGSRLAGLGGDHAGQRLGRGPRW